MADCPIIPRPVSYARDSGFLSLRRGVALTTPRTVDLDLRPFARRIRVALGFRKSEAVVSPDDARNDPRTRMHIEIRAGGAQADPQGYSLVVSKTGVEIVAASLVGVHYAVESFLQLARVKPGLAQCCRIKDAPALPIRGLMLDVSRAKMPKLQTLFGLVDRLSQLKFNQFQLYMENAFAYREHRDAWADATPYTADDIRRLDAYCREKFIELVPNQNCFGHMERWLTLPRYRHLAETQKPWVDPWGRTRQTPATLCPVNPKAVEFIESLLLEMGPCFSSRLMNVGCDETFELGLGRSAEECAKHGVGPVYVDFVKQLHRIVSGQDRRMMIWADMLQQHTKHIRDIPRDVILLEWGYEADHDFDGRCGALAAAKRDFYVCPGTSSWRSYSGRSDVAIENIRRAVAAGTRHGAAGFMLTDWGDGGHPQYAPVSYSAIAMGAALSWSPKTNADLDPGVAASAVFFDESSAGGGAIWYDCGLIYKRTGVLVHNGTILFELMQTDIDALVSPATDAPDPLKDLTPRVLQRTIDDCESIWQRARGWVADTTESRMARRELIQTAEILTHACRRALAVHAARENDDSSTLWRDLAASIKRISHKHRTLWLARNRPGGLLESRTYFEQNLTEYQLMGRRAVMQERSRERVVRPNLLEPMEITPDERNGSGGSNGNGRPKRSRSRQK